MNGIRTRRNVFELGSDWADPILWYARGVGAMKSRKLVDPTSWNFFGAIHGMWRALWDFYGITDPADPDPSAADTATYLDQCQHQSWYFLPWHRGYLLALEGMIRHEIEQLNGPHETWALPYWNYFAAGQNVLPPAFRTPDWPDGSDDNPLFVEQRWGPLSGSTPFDVASETNLGPMSDPDFSGPDGGGSAGFGGLDTGFNHGGGTNGELEADPHNIIHVLVGGRHPSLTLPDGRPRPGLMSVPATAGLDPIFYLHHCNIDRLWESWNNFPSGKPAAKPTDWKNPTDPNWLDGPASIGEREFAMPNPDGSEWGYVPRDMEEIAALGYEYDDLTPGAVVPPVPTARRMVTLGIAAEGAARARDLAMAAQDKVEMMGASEGRMTLAGGGAMRSSVRVEPPVRDRVTQSLTGMTGAGLPDRVFLNLENVRGAHDAVIFRVYVGLPEGADPADNEEYLAGSISLFGVSQASDPAGENAGNGITYAMEITKIVDKLHLDGDFAVDELPVQIVPRERIPEAAEVEIGRISLYRQYE